MPPAVTCCKQMAMSAAEVTLSSTDGHMHMAHGASLLHIAMSRGEGGAHVPRPTMAQTCLLTARRQMPSGLQERRGADQQAMLGCMRHQAPQTDWFSLSVCCLQDILKNKGSNNMPRWLPVHRSLCDISPSACMQTPHRSTSRGLEPCPTRVHETCDPHTSLTTPGTTWSAHVYTTQQQVPLTTCSMARMHHPVLQACRLAPTARSEQGG